MRRALSVSIRFCYLLLHLHLMSFTKKCLAHEFPNLYVFGDSIFDNGVKRSHESGMRAGYSPYGIECHWYDKFRFTNGRTIPEMIAVSLKLKLPTSFDESKFHPEHGVTYASASAGILPDTGSAFGTNYCLEEQIGFFKETLEKILRPKYQSEEELSKYLSDSIFLINIGSSDYIHNYLQPHDYNSSRQYNGEDFAQLLISKLGNHLKELYDLGARKMVIFEMGPLGCLPYIINKIKSRNRCDEDANRLASIFNDKLEAKLKELGEKLDGSIFVTARIFRLIKSMVEIPSEYGLRETRFPCCATQENGTGLCKQPKIHLLSRKEMAENRPKDRFAEYKRDYLCIESPPPPPPPPPPPTLTSQTESSTWKPTGDLCEDRGSFLYWDELHLTKAANRIIVDKCVNANSGGICEPYSINQLVNQR